MGLRLRRRDPDGGRPRPRPARPRRRRAGGSAFPAYGARGGLRLSAPPVVSRVLVRWPERPRLGVVDELVLVFVAALGIITGGALLLAIGRGGSLEHLREILGVAESADIEAAAQDRKSTRLNSSTDVSRMP